MWRVLLTAHFLLLTSSTFATVDHGKTPTAYHNMLQREIDLVPHLKLGVVVPGPRGFQPSLDCGGSRPCEHGHRHRLDRPKVTFPLGRPSAANVGDICRHLGERMAYGPGSLPSSGFGHLHRQAHAVHEMEAGYAKCCRSLNETDKLACTLTVWRDALRQFCQVEFSIKTKHYHCCKATSDKRPDCFADAGSSHGYGPAGRRRAEGTVASAPRLVTHPGIKMPEIAFPPAEPNQHNILNICRLKKFRPQYRLKSLPQAAYGWLLRRAKAVNQIESAYTKCCRGSEALTCAHKQWMEALSDFCEKEFAVKDRHHHCCKLQGHHRQACFRDEARHPKYDREVQTISLQHVTEPTMRILCQTPLKLLSKGPASYLVGMLKKDCCPLATIEERVRCGIAEKTIFSDLMCGRRHGEWTDRLKCCAKDAVSCFDSGYLAHVQLATRNRY